MRKQNTIKTVINGQEVTVEQAISDRVTIGQCIKYWRLRHGYSQAELAERIGVASPNVIAMWENGRRKPQKQYRLRLAEHIGYDILTKN
jgi:predicted transcriptional regulator